LERTARDAEHLRTDAYAPLVQRLDRDLVALTHLAEHIRLGNEASIEQQLGRARGANAELVLLLADGEARHVPLDEKRGDSLVAGRGIRVREDDEDAGFR